MMEAVVVVVEGSDKERRLGVADADAASTSFLEEAQVGVHVVKPHAESTLFAKRDGQALTFCDVSVLFKTKKQILHDVWGGVPAGSAGCILGESGAGKTSLLNSLAGRLRKRDGFEVRAEVRLGGRVIDPRRASLGSRTAYVEQSDDTVLATATAREALEFAAALRLPQNVSAAERDAIVEGLIRELSLDRCADSLLGDSRQRGVSGGEKRRTSIGVELVTRPRLLFVDEPTSGLDSANAKSVVEVLRVVAKAGATVLSTIHQPTSLIFFAFDVCLVLHAGRTVFAGPSKELAQHLQSRGVAVPEHMNPADVALDALVDGGRDPLKLALAKPTQSSQSNVISRKDDGDASTRAGAVSSITRQFYWLLRRRARTQKRSVIGLVIGSTIGVVLSIIFGLIFANAGARDDSEVAGFSSHMGAIVFVMISCQQGAATAALIKLPMERPVFVREFRNNTYSHWVYFVVALISDYPVTFVQELIKCAIMHFMIKLRGDYFTFVVICFLLNVAIAALAALCTSALDSVDGANAILPAVLVPQMLFTGLCVRVNQIPEVVRWGRYLCVLKFAVDAEIINEFECDKNDDPTICRGWYETNQTREFSMTQNCLIVIAYTIAAQLLGAYFLRRSIDH